MFSRNVCGSTFAFALVASAGLVGCSSESSVGASAVCTIVESDGGVVVSCPDGVTAPLPAGPAGPVGRKGLGAVINTVAFESSETCPTGGVRVETGLDNGGDGNADNGRLDPDEVRASQEVCNGAVGSSGGGGTSGGQTVVAELAVGDSGPGIPDRERASVLRPAARIVAAL